jgi:hypothetical protein
MSTNRPEESIRQKEYKSARTSNFIRFPDKPFPHSMLLVFEEYSYTKFKDGYGDSITNDSESTIASGRASGIGLRSMQSVELPFPKQLSDVSGLIYNNMQQNPLIEGAVSKAAEIASGRGGNLSDIPGAIQDAGKLGSQALAAMTSGGTGSLASLAQSIASTSTADATSMTKFMLSKFIPEFLSNAVNLSLGQALNPRETITFEGVQLKTHTFNWDLYPDNARDSDRIQEIISFMKGAVLPEAQDIGSGSGGIKKAFLKFPKTVKIYLIGVDQNFYMKFKPSMVSNMTVDYAAGGTLGIMAGGKPAGVNISITLQELQIETANDYAITSPVVTGEGEDVEAPDPDVNNNSAAGTVAYGTRALNGTGNQR